MVLDGEVFLYVCIWAFALWCLYRLLFSSAKGETVHDVKLMSTLANELEFYARLKVFLARQNEIASQFHLLKPKGKASKNKSVDDLMSELEDAIDVRHLGRQFTDFHINTLPILLQKKKNWFLRSFRDYLIQQVPKSKWRIRFAWFLAQRKKYFHPAVTLFWKRLYSTPVNNSQNPLREALLDCVRVMVLDRSFFDEVTVSHDEEKSKTTNSEVSANDILVTGIVFSIFSTLPEPGVSIETPPFADFEQVTIEAIADDSKGTLESSVETDTVDNAIEASGSEDAFDALMDIQLGIPFGVFISQVKKQNRLFNQGKISDTEAIINAAINIASKGIGGGVVGFFGKAFGLMVGGPVVAAIAGIGCTLLGIKIGGKVATDIQIERLREAQAEYDAKFEEKDKMHCHYYSQIQSDAEDLEKRLDEDIARLKLMHPKQLDVCDVNKRLHKALMQDLELAKKRQKDIAPSSSHDLEQFILYATHMQKELDAMMIRKLPALMHRFRTMPLLHKGQLWKYLSELERHLFEQQTQLILGLAGWQWIMQGIFHDYLILQSKKIEKRTIELNEKVNLWKNAIKPLERMVAERKIQLG